MGIHSPKSFFILFSEQISTQICKVIQYCNSNKLKMLGTAIAER